jgi:hypothetical protein
VRRTGKAVQIESFRDPSIRSGARRSGGPACARGPTRAHAGVFLVELLAALEPHKVDRMLVTAGVSGVPAPRAARRVAR